MPKRLRLNFPPEKKLAARRAYDKGAPQVEVAAILGCSQGTARRRIEEWGWEPERSPRPYRRRPKFRFVPDRPEEGRRDDGEIPPYGLGPERFEMTPPPSASDLALQMKQLVAREMRRVQTCGGPAPEVARTLASLAQTMRILPELPGAELLDFDVEDYRRKIAARLEVIFAQDAEIALYAASIDGGSI